MAQYTGTISLSDIERIQIYYKNRRNTMAGMRQVLRDTGGDIVMSGPIFLRSLKPCCHLKADGNVLFKPNYTAWAAAWNTPADFGIRAVPSKDANYIACVKCIISRNKVKMDYQPDMAYDCNRLALGTKGGNFAYFATEGNLSPEGLQNVLFGEGWDNAIMMDGGGTVCILFSDGRGFAGDGRVVPIWIVVHLKKRGCPYPVPFTTIRTGSRGDGARWVQWQLNRHGASLQVDGAFGCKSAAALKSFQKTAFPKEPEEWDGVCGPRTMEALLK